MNGSFFRTTGVVIKSLAIPTVVNDVWMIDDFMFCGGRIDKYHVVFLLNTSDKRLEIDVDLRIGCFCYPSCYSRPAKRLRK